MPAFGDITPDFEVNPGDTPINTERVYLQNTNIPEYISEDGSILVTLIPSNMPMTTVVGVYGLKPNSNRGRCYATYR